MSCEAMIDKEDLVYQHGMKLANDISEKMRVQGRLRHERDDKSINSTTYISPSLSSMSACPTSSSCIPSTSTRIATVTSATAPGTPPATASTTASTAPTSAPSSARTIINDGGLHNELEHYAIFITKALNRRRSEKVSTSVVHSQVIAASFQICVTAMFHSSILLHLMLQSLRDQLVERVRD